MNRPSVYELECFVVVAEELNFSRAAQRLNLSQPPLSRQIQALEEKLGCRLFERSTRSVAMTAAGEMFLKDAQALLRQLDGAAESVRRAGAGEVARLRLGFIGALLDEELVAVLQRFRERHPQCQVHLADLVPAPQLSALSEGSLDGAFIGALPRRMGKGLKALVWKKEPLLLALPQAHRLAGAKSLPLSRLQEEGWVMVSREAAPAFRREFDDWCVGAGLKPRIVQESERVAAVLTMVAANQGISLLPASAGKLLGSGVVFCPVVSRPKPMLEHAFVYREKAMTPELADFVALLRKFR
jgi:DNA-binding transcriptional LysR family regulator